MKIFHPTLFLICLASFQLNCADEIGGNQTAEGLQKEYKDNSKDDDSKNSKDELNSEPPPIGNFSLPASQQPYALFGFGGNVIDRGEVQLFYFADYFQGRKRYVSDMIPGVLFGVTDEFSLFFNFPFTPGLKDTDTFKYKEIRNHSKGWEDFFVQGEWAFYNKKTTHYVDQATLVTNVTVPTGSVKVHPPTGYGAPSFFVGGTFCRMMVHWFVFTAQGAIITTSDHRTKIGDQFLYQLGWGRNFAAPEGWIFAWMMELDGQYYKKNRFHGRTDPNSGGNVIFFTPSIWLSSKDVVWQFGASVPLNQNFFGRQDKFNFALNLIFAWSFY